MGMRHFNHYIFKNPNQTCKGWNPPRRTNISFICSIYAVTFNLNNHSIIMQTQIQIFHSWCRSLCFIVTFHHNWSLPSSYTSNKHTQTGVGCCMVSFYYSEYNVYARGVWSECCTQWPYVSSTLCTFSNQASSVKFKLSAYLSPYRPCFVCLGHIGSAPRSTLSVCLFIIFMTLYVC